MLIEEDKFEYVLDDDDAWNASFFNSNRVNAATIDHNDDVDDNISDEDVQSNTNNYCDNNPHRSNNVAPQLQCVQQLGNNVDGDTNGMQAHDALRNTLVQHFKHQVEKIQLVLPPYLAAIN